MATQEFQPHSTAAKLGMLIAGVVFLLMMIFGLIMRAAQGELYQRHYFLTL